MPLNDINWPQGKQNMGGLKGSVFFLPLQDVDFTTPPVFDVATKTITGDIVLIALRKWHQFYFTKSTGKLDFTVVGERDGKSFENMAEFSVPGGDPANMLVVDELINTPGIALVKDSSGNLMVLGISKNEDDSLNLDFPVYLESVAGTTGAAAADKRGMVIGIKSESPHSPLIYTGAIDLDILT